MLCNGGRSAQEKSEPDKKCGRQGWGGDYFSFQGICHVEIISHIPRIYKLYYGKFGV